MNPTDPIPATTPTAPITSAEKAVLQSVADDVGTDVAVVRQALAAYKAGGSAALIQAVPAAIEAARKTVADVQAALPVIKAGYRTTEFWLVAAVFIGNSVYFRATGHALPFDVNATLSGLTAVYAVVRGFLKRPAAPAPTP